MKTSRNRELRWSCALLLAAGLSAALAAPTSAQTGRERVGAPIPLRPGATIEAPKPPSGITVESSSPTQRPLGGARGHGGSDIEVGRLQALPPSAIGLLDESNGGFGLQMWAASDLSLIKRLVPRLPMTARSREMQSLARRLLLTTAALPAPETEQPSLLALRIERLAAGGYLDDIKELLKRTPAVTGESALIKTRINTMWLADESAEACGLARNLVINSADPLWQEAAAFCHLLQGDNDEVELYEQLLQEEGYKDPPFFAMLAAALGRRGTPLASLPKPTPLHMAMLRYLNWPLPDDAVEGAGPLVLRSLVEAGSASPVVRIEAAERAAASGALSVDRLRQMYAQLSFPPRDLNAAIGVAEKQPGARSNALLYQAARQASQPIERARILQLALAQARDSGLYATIAAANAASLKSIMPVPGLAWFAADGGRAMLAVNDFERALEWLRLAYETESPEGQKAAAILWPLLLVADDRDRVPLDEARFADWWRSQPQTSEAERAARAGLLLTILEALGRPLSAAVWQPLYETAEPARELTPPPVLVEGLRRAVDGLRSGEIVLLVLLNLGPHGPAGASPATLSQTISALMRLGLESDAHALAVEALLARAP